MGRGELLWDINASQRFLNSSQTEEVSWRKDEKFQQRSTHPEDLLIYFVDLVCIFFF